MIGSNPIVGTNKHRRTMVEIKIVIDGNKVAVNQSEAKPTKVTKTQMMYAVMYDYDESTVLYRICNNAKDANKYYKECSEMIARNLTCASAYIMEQDYLGHMKKTIESFDWDGFGADYDIDNHE